MVSFPLLASESLVKYPIGFSTGAIFFSSFKLAIPSFCIFGIERLPTVSAICPNVSVPASPKRSASFAPPIPQESTTIVKILRYFFASMILTPHFLFSIEICFSGKTFPAHALFFTVCPDQSADCLHTDRHCCLRVMNDRIIHAEGIALLISHDQKIRTTADFQMRSHNKQCR